MRGLLLSIPFGWLHILPTFPFRTNEKKRTWAISVNFNKSPKYYNFFFQWFWVAWNFNSSREKKTEFTFESKMFCQFFWTNVQEWSDVKEEKKNWLRKKCATDSHDAQILSQSAFIREPNVRFKFDFKDIFEAQFLMNQQRCLLMIS